MAWAVVTVATTYLEPQSSMSATLQLLGGPTYFFSIAVLLYI